MPIHASLSFCFPSHPNISFRKTVYSLLQNKFIPEVRHSVTTFHRSYRYRVYVSEYRSLPIFWDTVFFHGIPKFIPVWRVKKSSIPSETLHSFTHTSFSYLTLFNPMEVFRRYIWWYLTTNLYISRPVKCSRQLALNLEGEFIFRNDWLIDYKMNAASLIIIWQFFYLTGPRLYRTI